MLKQFSYDRSLAVIPTALKQVLEEAYRNHVEPELDDQQDELYTQICSVAPGLVEAYTTPEARDAGLGACAPYAEFIPATYGELAATGLTARNVAVGHRIGEFGFEEVVRAIVGDIAAEFLQSGEQTAEIVVGRVRYTIDRTGGVISWLPVYGEGPSDPELQATAAWLRREFGPRMNTGHKSDSTETGND